MIADGTGGSADRAPDATIDVSAQLEPSYGEADGRVLQATDSSTGKLRWQVPITTSGLGVPPITPLWVDSQVVIVASLATGPNPLIGVAGGSVTPPTTIGGPPVVLGSGSTLVALSASTGSELWRAGIGATGTLVSAAAGPAGVAVATQTALSLRDLDTGAVVATTPLSAGTISGFSQEVYGYPSNPLIVTGDTIALATSDANLTAYSPTLTRRWQRRLSIHHDPSALQLEAAEGTIYTIDQVSDPTSGC